MLAPRAQPREQERPGARRVDRGPDAGRGPRRGLQGRGDRQVRGALLGHRGEGEGDAVPPPGQGVAQGHVAAEGQVSGALRRHHGGPAAGIHVLRPRVHRLRERGRLPAHDALHPAHGVPAQAPDLPRSEQVGQGRAPFPHEQRSQEGLQADRGAPREVEEGEGEEEEDRQRRRGGGVVRGGAGRAALPADADAHAEARGGVGSEEARGVEEEADKEAQQPRARLARHPRHRGRLEGRLRRVRVGLRGALVVGRRLRGDLERHGARGAEGPAHPGAPRPQLRQRHARLPEEARRALGLHRRLLRGDRLHRAVHAGPRPLPGRVLRGQVQGQREAALQLPRQEGRGQDLAGEHRQGGG
mmetsp:Transcript_7292/g.21583  ORF Transcript_7292/g.21583 Transcript_7292/m.21583 type:complete len:357 (+) Transcript_7292:2190-3260(+)